ncbi:MAG TPA: Rieske 2Fe-2S domain-containing protein [Steroidobacteraceae bacterium]|nr:Rieske 2Fe-2S domain-containing protein [Steroidobacteraceae bacterium]
MGGEIDLTRVLCRVADLAGGSLEFRIGRGDWPLRGLVVQLGEDVRAYVNRCPHLAYPLNFVPHQFLTPDGSMIHCQAHGAVFEKATGYCVIGPCAGRSLIALPVIVESGYVLLSDEADPDALAALYA